MISDMNIPRAAEIYEQLGIRRLINAADTYTSLGGGALPLEVIAAMTEASSHHILVDDLLEKVGECIAQLLDVPGAFVTAGAAAGLGIAAAACMAGTDPGAVDALPSKTRGRNEFISLKCQRNPYDRAVVAAGGTLVEVGYADSTPIWSIDDGITERTAGLLFYSGTQFERFAPKLVDVANVAKERGVPLIVDSAAQFPPVSNLRSYFEEGADLVLFSGGKGIRGPQSSGLILGRSDLVEACAANAYPHHSIGRSAKSSKENILGLLAAVKRVTSMDWDSEYDRWSELLDQYVTHLQSIPELKCWIDPTGRLGQACPRLFIQWETGGNAGELVNALEQNTPSIMIGVDSPSSREVYINPFSVMIEEEEYLIDAVIIQLKRIVNE